MAAARPYRTACRGCRARGRGRVLFTSSIAALMPGPTETNFFHRAGIDDTKVGASAKDDRGDVARQGFEALMAGKDHVIAGSLKTKVIGSAAKAMPATLNAEQHRKMAEPGRCGVDLMKTVQRSTCLPTQRVAFAE